MVETHKNGDQWTCSDNSPLFVLDGHHKLLAYKETGIRPEFVHITRRIEETPCILLDYYRNISNITLRSHVISNNPAMFEYELAEIGDESEKSWMHNQEINYFLKTTSDLGLYCSELFLDILNREENEKLEWLNEKIEILENRDFSTGLTLYYLKDYDGNIYWTTMEVKSKQEFDDWHSKLHDDETIKLFRQNY